MYAFLVVQNDDDNDLAILSLVLKRAGMAVISDRDLDSVLASWERRHADLLVISVPHFRVEQVALIRSITLVPLIILAGRLTEQEHINLLGAGADIVIKRPYSTHLLVAQIQAFTRRAGSTPLGSLPTLSMPGLQLDPASRVVKVEGQPDRRLTHLEFRLLYTLMINRDQVLPTDTIVDKVWGYTSGDRNLVRGLISRLRHKVEPDPRNPRFIVTEPGIGYMLRSIEV